VLMHRRGKALDSCSLGHQEERFMRNIFVAGFAVLALSASAMATTLSSWNYEAVTTTNTGTTSSAGAADAGVFTVGTLSNGVHGSASTVWSNPAGNGSSKSFSSNTFALGDYYQFKTSSVGYGNIVVDFDQTSSNTGPRDFRLQYSTDGSSFTNFGSVYAVLANGTPNPAWNSSTSSAAYHFSFDLSSISALNNAANIYFRLAVASTVSANGGTVATAGTSRLDNVVIGGTVIPEPTSLALIALGALSLIRRR